MHTSVLPPLLEYSGTLIRAAEARTRMLDGHDTAVPVVCMDIELDNSLRHPMHVEKPFPIDHYTQAQAEARSLKKGMHITVYAPVMGLQLVARNVSRIAVIADAPAPSTDLFQEPST